METLPNPTPYVLQDLIQGTINAATTGVQVDLATERRYEVAISRVHEVLVAWSIYVMSCTSCPKYNLQCCSRASTASVGWVCLRGRHLICWIKNGMVLSMVGDKGGLVVVIAGLFGIVKVGCV